MGQSHAPGQAADPSAPGQLIKLLRPDGRPMSPMEEMAYFDKPRVTYPTVGANSVKQLLGKDPRRVAIVFHNNPANSSAITISPDDTWSNAGSIPANAGFLLNSNLTYLIVLQASLGNVCQWEWWAQNVSATLATVTIVETLLKEWPSE